MTSPRPSNHPSSWPCFRMPAAMARATTGLSITSISSPVIARMRRPIPTFITAAVTAAISGIRVTSSSVGVLGTFACRALSQAPMTSGPYSRFIARPIGCSHPPMVVGTAGPRKGPAGFRPSRLIAPVEARQGLPVAITLGAAS